MHLHDFVFLDILGEVRQHTYPKKPERAFFDGSSVPGFLNVEKSDLILIPDREFKWLDDKSRYICDVVTASGETFSKDPRGALKAFLSGLDFEVFVAPEIEFFAFKDREPLDNKGYFYPTNEIVESIGTSLLDLGIPVKKWHHEVANGQYELSLEHGDPLSIADFTMLSKSLIKILMRKKGLHATFMPKPDVNQNGSGMHIHISLWKDGENLFKGGSDEMRYFAGGILHHAKSLSSILSPTVNSYKRLVPHKEAPNKIAWGESNRSCLVRIPLSTDISESRIEVRNPDMKANPYLAILAVISCGLDGIENEIGPGPTFEENVYHIKDVEQLPSNLGEAVEFLKKDECIKRAFGPDLFNTFAELKSKEWKEFIDSNKWDSETITEWEIERYF